MERRTFLEILTSAVIVGSHDMAFAGDLTANKKIPKRILGKTGVEVSVLIIGGVVGMKQVPTKEFHPAELANAALDAGINYFDTAPSYAEGQSERNYGEVVAHRRPEVFLATKTGRRRYDDAMREVEESLKRLRTDHVDLLQIHGVAMNEDLESWSKPDGVLTALLKLREQKVTRFLGVTGHDSADKMRRAIEMYEFDTILTTFNPTEKRRPFKEQVLPLAQKKNMGILAMKVMGGGVGSLAMGNPIKNDGASNHDDASHQSEPGKLIRYVLGLPISAAVVGIASLQQLKTNVLAVSDYAPLKPIEQESLEKLMA